MITIKNGLLLIDNELVKRDIQIKDGKIRDSKTICAFNYYLLNKENL